MHSMVALLDLVPASTALVVVVVVVVVQNGVQCSCLPLFLYTFT